MRAMPTSTPTTTIATITSRPTLLSPPVVDTSNDDPVTSRPTTTRMTWTTPAASEFSTPELAATATVWPCFWKKRMTSAVFATVPPMSPVKLLANCSATSGAYGSGTATAPWTAIAPVNCGSGESAAATTTHRTSAFCSVAHRSTPAN